MPTTKFFIRCVLGCLILAGMLQPGASWATLAPFDGIGGSGGAPFRVDCGESGISVGMIDRSGAFIDQVGGLCVKIDPFSGTWVGDGYKHLGLTALNRLVKLKERWEGPVQLGSGWQDFQKVIALIPDPPKPPA